MSKNKKPNNAGRLALLIVTFFVFLGLLMVMIAVSNMNVKKAAKHKKPVQQETTTALDQEKEKIAMQKGYSKMIAGQIESIDETDKSLVINVDPFGSNQTYEISTNENTRYLMMKEALVDEAELDEEGFVASLAEPEISLTKFEFVEAGQSAEVHFSQRIDLDSAPKLTAQRIVIFPN